ncbi:MAG TPA: methyltransferase [Micromonospora sp.]|nr:methyltransferase [Micromonospora sp.]
MPVPLTPEQAHQFDNHDAPVAHLDLLNAISFRSATAGLRLGVFEALADGPRPAAALAEQISVDPLGLRILLDALVGFGYLTCSDGGYANSTNTTRWLLRTATNSYAPVLSFWGSVIAELWGDLEESVRRGDATGDFYHWLEDRPETLADFHMMLRRLAGWLAEEVLSLVPAPPLDGTMLDLGGGHAAYTIAFCRAYPQLRATVLDLPGALAQGTAAVAEAQLNDRVKLRPGDLFSAEFGAGHDLVLLLNILHGYPEHEAAQLLKRVAAALRPGGQVVLLEPLAESPQPPPGIGDAWVRAFSLNLFHTQGGRAYGLDELSGLLTAAGFTDLRQHLLTRSDTDHLVLATRA